jgi:hypothetical protein
MDIGVSKPWQHPLKGIYRTIPAYLVIDEHEYVIRLGVFDVFLKHRFAENANLPFGPYGAVNYIEGFENPPPPLSGSPVFFGQAVEALLKVFFGITAEDTHVFGERMSVKGKNVVVEEERTSLVPARKPGGEFALCGGPIRPRRFPCGYGFKLGSKIGGGKDGAFGGVFASRRIKGNGKTLSLRAGGKGKKQN